MTKKAYLVAFCGIDGSGKSSVLSALRADARFAGARFVAKRHRDNVDNLRRLEPTEWSAESSQLSGAFAEAIRWAHAFDFLRFYEDEVAQSLLREQLILSDRWTVCSCAFARCGTAVGPDIEAFLGACVAADLLVYLDVPAVEAIRRIAQRPGGCLSDETETILGSYRRAYETVLSTVGSRIVRLRNDDLPRTVEAVASHIVQSVPEHLLN